MSKPKKKYQTIFLLISFLIIIFLISISQNRNKISNQEIKVAEQAIRISLISLKESENKLIAGIGNKLDVLEAKAQLSRDRQSLNEKKIQHKINMISLKEILNIKINFNIKQDQVLVGFWNHKLYRNINNGLAENLSLKNITLQKSI